MDFSGGPSFYIFMRNFPEKITAADLRDDALLFDFQVNGFGGVDFQSADLSQEALVHAVDRLRWHRMSAILLTLVTDSIDALCKKLERIESYCVRDPQLAKTLCGYHIEGPWISDKDGYNGAHPIEHTCSPRPGDFEKLQEAAGGRIRLITLAPEVEGCISMIETITRSGVRVALGHTNATMEEIEASIQAGATLGTHVGNGVPSVLHRHDNIIQRILSREELIPCFIPDGIHLPPFVLKNFYRGRASKKAFFTTDCMAAAGAPPGCYTIGHLELEVGEDRVVRLPGENRFAGSALTLDFGVKNIVNWLGLDETTALKLCSVEAAAHFGITLAGCRTSSGPAC